MFWTGKTKNVRKLRFLLMLAILVSSSILNGIKPNLAYAEEPGTYYVSTTGDDNNSGTWTSPWRTIQKAADTLLPGDTVFVRGGAYSEFVSIYRSGSKEGGDITFQNYLNEIPIIDGTGKEVTSRNQVLLNLSNVSYVTVSGFEIRNLITSNHSLYPAGIRVKNGGSFIQLLNNNVHHIENRSNGGNAHGIHVLGNMIDPITNIVINGNQVHHLITGTSESVTLSGNIDGFTIKSNHIYENNNIGIDVAGFYGACGGPCVDQVRNGIISGNTIHDIDTSNNPAYGTGNTCGRCDLC